MENKRMLNQSDEGGYIFDSMSEAACAAYGEGEKPWSVWTKADILKRLEEVGFADALVHKLTLAQLRGLFLVKSSCHQTGRYRNPTDFYSVSIKNICREDIANAIDRRNDRSDPDVKLCRIHYGIWERRMDNAGVERYALREDEVNAIVIERIAYCSDGSKKRMTGSHIRIAEEFDDIPSALLAEFRSIYERLPQSKKKKVRLFGE